MTNCFKQKGNKLVNGARDWVQGTVMTNGDLKWSHGYITRFDGSPCNKCLVTLDHIDGKELGWYTTPSISSLAKPFEGYNILYRDEKKPRVWHSKCTRNCAETGDGPSTWIQLENNILQLNDTFGYLQPDGSIFWSSGHISFRRKKDLCRIKPTASFNLPSPTCQLTLDDMDG